MNELIKLSLNEKGEQVVSARELYDFLGYDLAHWAKWYEKNIIKNDFAIENEDWVVFTPSAKTSGGRTTKDFVITFSSVKEVKKSRKK